MNFDTPIDRRGQKQTKWDRMEELFGVSPADGLAMWTADSDYPTAPCVRDALFKAAEHGVFGYSWLHDDYLNAVAWWMHNRHGWDIDTDWILTAQGLGNAIALSIDAWSDPGDSVVIFSPVYLEFSVKIKKAGRVVNECPLKRAGDTYVLDLEDAQSRLTGREKLLIWCSPQNPSGRIWTAEELRQVADFARKNNLILVSDEVHHDLVYAGEKFIPMAVAAPEAQDISVYLTAASKTFNIAGQRTGNMIIPDPELRQAIKSRLHVLDYMPAGLSVAMITAAYSPEGAAWVDAQMAHLKKNRDIFDSGISKIPGVYAMPLQSTYLAWVDFSGTGMTYEEIENRIKKTAKIAPSPGPSFGAGGETFMRFNLATQTDKVTEAVTRLQYAFRDLQ
ncbi:cystathione beta-lyase [Yoonia tamlensis]|uniref:cysteine-S-conjugate beta-lyase n=1 Tax=Yoonia tamlensis TaxID=390270 RepID=A0A1I6FPL6_9RHOB|nr:PatB family C-S lyase [Yoonia tamlensis]SFR31892.1 cystathione beta-lyase [Yoonia tamlensis]